MRFLRNIGANDPDDADQDAFWGDHWDGDPELADLRLTEGLPTPRWLARLLTWIDRPLHG